MTWHYQVRRRDTEHGPLYGIVEVYTRPHGETAQCITPMSESRRGIIRVLEMMLHDARKYKTLKETP